MEPITADRRQTLLRGQAEVWRHMFAFADSMALKCAVELGIADIIYSQGGAATLSKIVSCIDDSVSPDPSCLARIMMLLVRRQVFTLLPNPSESDGPGPGEPLYGLTDTSRWLLHDSELSLAPMILMENHPSLMAPWHYFSSCVKEGGVAFEKAHGRKIWDLAAQDPSFNKLFNDAMACTSKVITQAILSGYMDGLSRLESLVDVGGGTGSLVGEIAKSHPHIKCINFDLPHVVATAPRLQGVSHIGGDMFQFVPNANAAILKFLLHDWSDEDCVKILRNCRKAIPEESGKIIIVECVLKADGNEMFDDIGFMFDLLMIAHASGGRERTELEWKNILEKGGFPTYKIIKLPALTSIIEAFPK